MYAQTGAAGAKSAPTPPGYYMPPAPAPEFDPLPPLPTEPAPPAPPAPKGPKSPKPPTKEPKESASATVRGGQV